MRGGILETPEVVETLSLTQKYHKVKGMFGALPILFVFDYLRYRYTNLDVNCHVQSLSCIETLHTSRLERIDDFNI